MTQNKPSEPKRGMKTWGLVGLFSVMILGGVGFYGIQSLNSHPVAEETSPSSESKEKASLRPWEKQVTEKSEEKKATEKQEKVDDRKTTNQEKTADKLSGLDQILRIVTGPESPESEDSRIFGMDVLENPSEEKNTLLKELAQAVEKQLAKEEKREVKQKAEENKPVDQSIAASEESSLVLDRPLTPPEEPELHDPLEGVTVDPISEIPQPDIPVTPTPLPSPGLNEEKEEKPDNRFVEMISENRLALTDAKDQVARVNAELLKIKSSLDQLESLEENTATQYEDATQTWQRLSLLVSEYNRLSQEIKELVEENDEVLPIHYEHYNELYQGLATKIQEMEDVQKQANDQTTQFKKVVEATNQAFESYPEMVTNYESLQSDVTQTVTKAQLAVSRAETNPNVKKEVQTEIQQAVEATDTVTWTNQEVGKQLEERTPTEASQEKRNQQVMAIEQEAKKQTAATNTASADFKGLPQRNLSESSNGSESSVGIETPGTDISVASSEESTLQPSESTETTSPTELVPPEVEPVSMPTGGEDSND